ncbi:protein CutA homolog isoform X2 [Lytechinus pictus]|uniref:protein CutA homolog isoform X2 n=1 Tax=Lytechinus pictus TaxID=7653 RepID=UPI0030B9EE15
MERRNLLETKKMASSESSTEIASKLTAAFVTVPGVEVGEKLASDIVKQKLAACVNMIPGLTSVYEWDGKIEKDQEVLLMIKTRRSKIDELSEYMRKNHPYDVAEVISLPIENGNLPYLQWVTKCVPE